MKTIKNYFETIKNQFNSLSANYKLVVVNAVVALFGTMRGIQLLIAGYSVGWWESLFNSPQDMIIKGWSILSLSLIAGGIATVFYVAEERKYKKVQDKIKEAINNINKENAVDTEAIPV